MKLSRKGLFAAIKSVLIPRSAYQALGQALTVLSLLAIIKHIAVVGFISAFSIMVDVYGNFIHLTIGQLDPLVMIIIGKFRSVFTIQIPFQPGWRYIFIVLQLLFVRDAGTAYTDGRRLLALVRFVIGTSLSLLMSIGIFLSYKAGNGLLADAIFCGTPVLGIFIYDVVMYGFSATIFFNEIGTGEVDGPIGRYSFFLRGLRRSFYRLLIVYLPSLAALFIPFVQPLPFPKRAVVAILVGMFANASYWILYGLSYAIAEERAAGLSMTDAFHSSEAGRFGLAVVGVLAWLFLFLLVNAGGRLLGL